MGPLDWHWHHSPRRRRSRVAIWAVAVAGFWAALKVMW